MRFTRDRKEPQERDSTTIGADSFTVTITEPVQEQNPDVFLEAARIMATIPDSQRYVINCLRHVVPDIDAGQAQERVTEVKTNARRNQPAYFQEGVDMDIDKLKFAMNTLHYSTHQLAEEVGVSVTTVNNWIRGKSKPLKENRTRVCIAIGMDENFLTPQRTRRRK
jgi:DNA-binding transcriptional regulator YiaG